MKKTLFIFGRHPAISLAEIAAVFPDAARLVRGADFAIFDLDPARVDMARLGGVVKVGDVFFEGEELSYPAIADALTATHASGKLSFGASTHGLKYGSLKTLLIGTKKELAKRDITARFVNKDSQNLTSAQVELQGIVGAEILAVSPNARAITIARTIAVQPFEEFKKRDYEKTARDARVGMLPPKLALMMVNIGCGAGGRGIRGDDTVDTKLSPKPYPLTPIVYDPFCGTGTVLVEAARLGCAVVGSDISPEMIAATEANLAFEKISADVFVHDAHKIIDKPADVIVTEGYLGPAMHGLPNEPMRRKIFTELATLYRDFFAWAQARRVVLTLPVFIEAGQPRHFSSKEIQPAIEGTGFRRVDDGTLVYYRPDQIVGREITVWER